MTLTMDELKEFLDELSRQEKELLEQNRETENIWQGDINKSRDHSYDLVDSALGQIDSFIGGSLVNILGLPPQFYEAYNDARKKWKGNLYDSVHEFYVDLGASFDERHEKSED